MICQSGFARADRFDGLADPLDAALGVGDRAVALCKRGRGQDDVCLCGSLGHEKVLDDEKVEFGECIGDVGACRGDVLADHVKCLDLAGCCRFDHGRDSKAPLTGNCADIGRSLGIALAAEEVDPCAGLPTLPVTIWRFARARIRSPEPAPAEVTTAAGWAAAKISAAFVTTSALIPAAFATASGVQAAAAAFAFSKSFVCFAM